VVLIEKIYKGLYENLNALESESDSPEEESKNAKDDKLNNIIFRIQSKAKSTGKTLEKLLKKHGNSKNGVRPHKFERLLEEIDCDLNQNE